MRSIALCVLVLLVSLFSFSQTDMETAQTTTQQCAVYYPQNRMPQELQEVIVPKCGTKIVPPCQRTDGTYNLSPGQLIQFGWVTIMSRGWTECWVREPAFQVPDIVAPSSLNGRVS